MEVEQLTLDLFGQVRNPPMGYPYASPCPIRETCAAYLIDDGIREDGSTYPRGCTGGCGWCGRAIDYTTKGQTKWQTRSTW